MNTFDIIFGEPSDGKKYHLKHHKIAFNIRDFVHTNTIYIRCSLLLLIYFIGLFHWWKLWMGLTTIDTLLSLYILHLDRMLLYQKMKEYNKRN